MSEQLASGLINDAHSTLITFLQPDTMDEETLVTRLAVTDVRPSIT